MALTTWDGKAYFTLTDTERWDANVLYESMLGFELVWTWIPIGIAIFVIVVRDLFEDYFQNENGLGQYNRFESSTAAGASGDAGRMGPVPGAAAFHDLVPSKESLMDARLSYVSISYRVIILFVLLLVILPGLWVATTFLPGDWHKGFVYQIAGQSAV